jgi:hypothetical protein
MRKLNSTNIRWGVAGALALGAIGLTTRDSSAFQNLIAEFTSTNAKCTGDASGNPYEVRAFGFDKTGNAVCIGGAIAAGAGATSEQICSDLNRGVNRATQQTFILGVYTNSNGAVSSVCGPDAPGPWGTPQSCTAPAIVTSSCPAGNKVTGAVNGQTF